MFTVPPFPPHLFPMVVFSEEKLTRQAALQKFMAQDFTRKAIVVMGEPPKAYKDGSCVVAVAPWFDSVPPSILRDCDLWTTWKGAPHQNHLPIRWFEGSLFAKQNKDRIQQMILAEKTAKVEAERSKKETLWIKVCFALTFVSSIFGCRKEIGLEQKTEVHRWDSTLFGCVVWQNDVGFDYDVPPTYTSWCVGLGHVFQNHGKKSQLKVAYDNSFMFFFGMKTVILRWDMIWKFPL